MALFCVRHASCVSSLLPIALIFTCCLAAPAAASGESSSQQRSSISASAKLSIQVKGLVPGWSRKTYDYTVACEKPVVFRVQGKRRVSIDGGRKKRGSFVKKVRLEPGQATRIRSHLGKQTVRCRPDDLKLPEVEGKGQSGTYLVSPTIDLINQSSGYSMVVDANGTPLWWRKDPDGTIIDFRPIDRNTFAWVRGGQVGFVIGPNEYKLYGFNGRLKRSISPVGFGADHHDIEPTADGGFLLIGYVPRNCPGVASECVDLSGYGGSPQATIIDGVIQKVDSRGKEVWTWSTRDHIAIEESDFWLQVPQIIGGSPITEASLGVDVVHINSVEADGNGFVFSARHTNAVYRVFNPARSGRIDWKVGGTPTPESLQIVGDPFSDSMFGGQHDARILPNGNLTVHDNGTNRNRPPRAVRYRIGVNTAALMESFSEDDVPASSCCGSVRRRPSGDWLASWGGSAVVAEYSPNGRRHFRLAWPAGFTSYRAHAASKEQLRKRVLRRGMSALHPRRR